MADISVNDFSTLTTEEYNNLVTYFGGVVEDINSEDVLYYLMHPEEIPDGAPAVDDWLAFYVIIADTIPPDSSSLDYLWADSGAQTVMQEFVLDWQDEDSMSEAIERAQTVLLEQGISTDIINQISNNVIQPWIDEHGTLTSDSSAFDFSDFSEPLADIVTLMRTHSPMFILMLMADRIYDPMTTEILDVSLEQREELLDERLDIQDEMQGIDILSDEATLELKDVEFREKLVDEKLKQLDDLDKSQVEFLGSIHELISDLQNMLRNTNSSIIRGIGS